MTPPQFAAFAKASLSVTAAHTILRAIADRSMLATDQDIATYVSAVAGEDQEAGRVALDGLRIVSSLSKTPLVSLPEEDARNYITWLADFAIARASGGKAANPDVGRTLLAGLRKVGSVAPTDE